MGANKLSLTTPRSIQESGALRHSCRELWTRDSEWTTGLLASLRRNIVDGLCGSIVGRPSPNYEAPDCSGNRLVVTYSTNSDFKDPAAFLSVDVQECPRGSFAALLGRCATVGSTFFSCPLVPHEARTPDDDLPRIWELVNMAFLLALLIGRRKQADTTLQILHEFGNAVDSLANRTITSQRSGS